VAESFKNNGRASRADNEEVGVKGEYPQQNRTDDTIEGDFVFVVCGNGVGMEGVSDKHGSLVGVIAAKYDKVATGDTGNVVRLACQRMFATFPVKISGTESSEQRDILLKVTKNEISGEIFHSQSAPQLQEVPVAVAGPSEFFLWFVKALGQQFFVEVQAIANMTVCVKPRGVKDLQVKREDPGIKTAAKGVAAQHHSEGASAGKRRHIPNDLFKRQSQPQVPINGVQTRRTARCVVRLFEKVEMQTRFHNQHPAGLTWDCRMSECPGELRRQCSREQQGRASAFRWFECLFAWFAGAESGSQDLINPTGRKNRLIRGGR